MEDKPLTESINKQYSKYGSLRMKEKESKIKLCNPEDPLKFLTRIDSSIEDAKARVKKSIDSSTISEDYDSSFDQHPNAIIDADDDISLFPDTIPMVKLDRSKSSNNSLSNNQEQSSAATSRSTSNTVAYLQDEPGCSSSSGVISNRFNHNHNISGDANGHNKSSKN